MIFFPGSARVVSTAVARRIVDALPAFVTPVALFVNPTAEEVRRVTDEVGAQLLQFHGDETPEFCAQFQVPHIKAAKVMPGVDLLQYARLHGRAKGLLLDAFVAGSQGGTGTTFDWALIPARLSLPLILAGGLNPDNIGDAIRKVRPWAVDVSSGVESAIGKKDAAKITAFMRGVRNADG
jgi:phosphoribosylanthranilate isomerase